MRTRNHAVVLIGVALMLLTLVVLGLRLRGDDSGGRDDAAAGDGLAGGAGQTSDASPRTELDPATSWQGLGMASGTSLGTSLGATGETSSGTSDGSTPLPPAGQTSPRGESQALGDLRPPTGPLVSRPLPAPGTRRAGVVAGYPHQVLRVLPGARVRETSVSAGHGVVQATLTATTTRSPDAAGAFYRKALARYGFAEQRLTTAGGTPGFGFRRGHDSVAVTMTPRGSHGWTLALIGVLHAGSS